MKIAVSMHFEIDTDIYKADPPPESITDYMELIQEMIDGNVRFPKDTKFEVGLVAEEEITPD